MSLSSTFLFFAFLLKSSEQLPVFSPSPDKPKEINSFYYYITPESNLTVQDVLKKNFALSLKNDLGITNNVIWVYFNIRNKNTNDSLYLEVANPLFREITFYSLNNNIAVDSLSSGRLQPFDRRYGDFVNYVYPLKINPGSELKILIKIKTDSPTHLPIFLFSRSILLKKNFNDSLLFGIYIGIIIIMIAYHAFISFTVNDKSYIYYLIYIAAVGFAQIVLKGYAFKYLWPNNVWLSVHSINLSGIISGFTTLVFAKVFLQTKKQAPSLNISINSFILIYILILFVHFFISNFLAFRIINISALLGSAVVIYTAYRILKKGFKPANFFLLAFSIFLGSVVIYVLRTSGFIGYNFFTSYILEIGSVLQIIILSLALADKINTYRHEQSVAKAEALRISKENERLVTEQNVLLEREVKIRTNELENANNDLNQTLSQLKLAQAKLVDSEKMASLGQLTAGVAHEINNPINFVTSNIKPLELDIQDIFEVLKKYENLDPSAEIQPQLDKIAAFKKEIDISYVGQEIKSLLSGIKDGATRTAEIVKNLKNFVRLDQANLKLADLNDGINSTLVLVRNTFPDKMVLEKQLGQIPLVECSPGKLNQVFMNIITNAVQAIKNKKYKNEEFPVLSIKSWSETEQEVNISVKDNGIGMPHSVIEKIYEPFFTTKDVGEGTGLGMSIVKGIVESHKGNLEIHSTPGEGTEFILTLPIVSPTQ